MYSLLFLACFSFLLSFTLTPAVRNMFRGFGVVDQPDNDRKFHRLPTPRVGGIVIVSSYSLSFLLLLVTRLKGGALISDAFPFAWKLLPAAGLIFVTGLLDDLFRLRPLQKLTGQVIAATAAYFSGICIHVVNGRNFDSWWSLPLTILWLVTCANALNLVDGLDGLASGIGFFATTTSLLAALIQHNIELAFATLPLAGALLGFLRYNFNPATIFLGDCGSLFIGFMLGCYGVLWSQKSATMLGMAAPLIAFSIPLLDISLAVVRRFLLRRPILYADRGHIHHRLLDHGLTPKRAVLLLYGVCALFAAFSLLMANNGFELIVIVTFCILTFVGVQRLGYVDFAIAKGALAEGSFRKALSSQILLRDFKSRLSLVSTPEECWSVLREFYKKFGFYHIHVQLLGRNFSEGARPHEVLKSWRLEIPLSPYDYVQLAREFGPNLQHSVVTLFADALRKTLESKLPSFMHSKPAMVPDVSASEAALEALHATSPRS